MPSDCPYCGKQHLNFGDDDDGVKMWIERPYVCEYVIAAHCQDASDMYAWSIPINFCPFCGRKLEKEDE